MEPREPAIGEAHDRGLRMRTASRPGRKLRRASRPHCWSRPRCSSRWCLRGAKPMAWRASRTRPRVTSIHSLRRRSSPRDRAGKPAEEHGLGRWRGGGGCLPRGRPATARSRVAVALGLAAVAGAAIVIPGWGNPGLLAGCLLSGSGPPGHWARSSRRAQCLSRQTPSGTSSRPHDRRPRPRARAAIRPEPTLPALAEQYAAQRSVRKRAQPKCRHRSRAHLDRESGDASGRPAGGKCSISDLNRNFDSVAVSEHSSNSSVNPQPAASSRRPAFGSNGILGPGSSPDS